jgi:hypothetical protein
MAAGISVLLDQKKVKGEEGIFSSSQGPYQRAKHSEGLIMAELILSNGVIDMSKREHDTKVDRWDFMSGMAILVEAHVNRAARPASHRHQSGSGYSFISRPSWKNFPSLETPRRSGRFCRLEYDHHSIEGLDHPDTEKAPAPNEPFRPLNTVSELWPA